MWREAAQALSRVHLQPKTAAVRCFRSLFFAAISPQLLKKATDSAPDGHLLAVFPLYLTAITALQPGCPALSTPTRKRQVDERQQGGSGRQVLLDDFGAGE